MSDKYVIVVDLVVDDAQLADFMPLIADNARTSLAEEPGCLRFDICQDNTSPTKLLLYEVYSDAAAFNAHLSSLHFRRFDAATAAMLTSKQVRVLTLQS